MKSKEELEFVVESVATTIGSNLILTGEFFRAVQVRMPERFAELAFLTGIDIREAERLAAMDRIFKELNVDRERMYRIGLAKLQIISIRLSAGNCESLLQLAESSTPAELVPLMHSKRH